MPQIESFDATHVPPREQFDPIPNDDYKAMIINSSVEKTNAGTGEYAKFEWQILEGTYAGRHIFQNLNLKNPNPKAVEIGKQELSATCHAAGKLKIDDTAELHNIPMIIRVKIKPPQGQYPAGNEVKGVKSLTTGSNVPALVSSQQAHQQPQVGRPPAKPPWQR